MQVNELPAAEANRMREKLSAVNASIAANVGERPVEGSAGRRGAGTRRSKPLEAGGRWLW